MVGVALPTLTPRSLMAATRDQGPEPGAGSQSSDGNVASPGPASLALHAVAVPAVYWILDRAVRAAATRSPDLFPRNSVLDVMIGSPRAALLSVAFGTGAAAYVALHRGLQASLARFAFYKVRINRIAKKNTFLGLFLVAMQVAWTSYCLARQTTGGSQLSPN